MPLNWQRRVFDAIHGLSHPLARRTICLINTRFVWHGINKDITAWSNTCLSCQSAKIHHHVSAPLQQFATPGDRFDSIHIDIVGPLSSSRGTSYLFTIVDRFTRWPEAIPMTDATALSCAQALLENWVPRFGVPTDMTSDRGRQFTSGLWKELGKLSTAYHPQSNGLVERFHRQLKASLNARLHGPNWQEELPLILLGIRTATKEDLGCTSAELVYGKTLRLPDEFFEKTDRTTDPIADALELLPRLRETMCNLRAKPTTQHRHHTYRVPAALLTCTFVFVRRDAHRTPLQCPYDGLFRVLERTDKCYTLDIRGITDTVSIDRLKPAFVDADFDSVSGPTTVVRSRQQRTSPVPGLPQATAPAMPLASTQVRRTRSGRQSRPPDRL